MLHHDSQLEHFFIKFSWLNCQSIILIWSVSSVCGSFHLCSNADQSWFISVHPQIRMTFSVLWNVVFPVHFLTLVKCYVLWMLGYIVPCALQWTGIFLGCIAAPRRDTIEVWWCQSGSVLQCWCKEECVLHSPLPAYHDIFLTIFGEVTLT